MADYQVPPLGDDAWLPWLTRGQRPDAEATVLADDLLQCMQVAVWRAGLLDAEVLDRLKSALGLGKLDSVPKPPPKP